ncbi:helix-turn-helix domain-containing protein [Pseudoxanthomonas winnipegensis]|uniref:helix-turn-helix domain-containing protein n=1 Tax=Pseudoxanthomonas winnipegensis TaxID=2480810 RepID=UPI003F82439A
MDIARRRQGFASRFNKALETSGRSGLSDGELLKLFGRHGIAVTTQTVSNWRNGKHMPRLEQIEGLAEALNMEAAELAFGGKGGKLRVQEPRAAWHANSPEERTLVEGLALLEPEEKALVQELVRVLGQRHAAKRRGRRKRV